MSRFLPALEVLLQVPLPVLPPPSPPVSIAVSPRQGGPVLCVGPCVPATLRRNLESMGCTVSWAHTLEAAWRALPDRHYQAIAVEPTVHREGDGLRFVRALQQRLSAPLIVLPLPGEHQFAVFHHSGRWSHDSTRRCGLAWAILSASQGEH